ncbi:hypothetical protein MKW94_004639, partial [Papaver nudicaule]|nr:hypothetical protein [Papaver nudicaule]
ALVEVKPVLFVPEDNNNEIESQKQDQSMIVIPNYWDFDISLSLDSCCQKYVVRGKICAVTLSIDNELATMICSESLDTVQGLITSKHFGTEKHLKRIARLCIYLLDKNLLENDFSWEDIM